jgi:DNA helicase HerA-like ATPase
MRQPATKAPLESLLRRARSAGLGLMLATQSPGDLDYRCRENIRGWLVGRVTQTTAINKLKPMFAEARLDAAGKLPGQQTGEFYLLRERTVSAVRTEPSLIETRQLPEQRILELARSDFGA